MPRTSAAEWVRSHYGVPAQTHRRIAYTGDRAKGRQLGEIVGFSGGHLRIRLDGERRILTTHPTWEMEYLPEVTNEQYCEQCGRTGTRGFQTLKAAFPGTPDITVCANNSACRKRWPKPVEIDEQPRPHRPTDRHHTPQETPVTSHDYGTAECPTCRRTHRLRKNGSLWIHNNAVRDTRRSSYGKRCSGSGQWPAGRPSGDR